MTITMVVILAVGSSSLRLWDGDIGDGVVTMVVLVTMAVMVTAVFVVVLMAAVEVDVK